MLFGMAYIAFFVTLLGTLSLYVGQHFWLLELFSHFVPAYFAASLLLLLLFAFSDRKLSAFVCLILLFFYGYSMMPLWVIPPEHRVEAAERELNDNAELLTLLQFNVNYESQAIDEKLEWLMQQQDGVDVVILLEVTEDWNKALQKLAKKYRYSLVQPVRGVRGIAIFSRLPQTEFNLYEVGNSQNSYVTMHARTRKGLPLTLFAVHPPPPLNHERAERRNRILLHAAESLAKEGGYYKLLAGDFNLTRWSPWFAEIRNITGLRDSFEGSGLQRTWPAFLPSPLGIVIDNLLISNKIKVEHKWVASELYSDHAPVTTTLRLEK